MKICYLGNAADVHTQRWAKHFATRGYQITVVSFEPAEIENVKVFSLPRLSSQRHLNILLNLGRIRKIVKQISPDILHAHYATSYGLAGKVCGLQPFIVTTWGSDIFITPEESFLFRLLVKWVLSRADLVTSMAEHMTSFMNERGYSAPDRIMTLPFGVDTKQFNPGCRLHGFDDKHVKVISTRKHDDVYDIGTLICAIPLVLAKYPLTEFVIVGDGPLRKSLEDLAMDLKVNESIDFLGKISCEDMPKALGASDIFVSTCISDGNNISLNEAMACGSFPVVSDIPANREWVVHGKNGLIFPCSNIESLAEMILKAIQEPKWRRATAAENWGIINHRGSWAKNMARMEKFYRSLGTCSPD